MIPILYDKTETAFVSNGLARLRDCISCIVSEERNSIYECDFEYPVNGANYDLIQVGRIVGVTHDESGDIQPFDIVSFTKPIDGVVTFHCTHISYRQSYITIKGSNINSLSDAFTQITTYAKPATPFTYWSDKTSTGYVGAFDGIPKTVRQILGGVEGSLLDAYGGEYEWDKWTVKLWSARGQFRDFSIRYGVNMLDYNEEYDTSNCYSSVRPYWTDGTTAVIGDKQDSGSLPPSGRDQCVPLDVSEKFENKPTKAQVESAAVSYMNSNRPTIPTQNIEVSFVRLQDMGEYADYQNLLQCKLCDTINVIFPDFNSSGQFKIVQTEWNVLTGKYESMQLGDLAITLSEAMGINDIQQTSKSTIEQILAELPVKDSGANHLEVAGVHICWGSRSFAVTANTYTQVEEALPYTYTGTGTFFVIASTYNQSAQVRTAYASIKDTSTIYLGGVATTARNVGVTWIAIGT